MTFDAGGTGWLNTVPLKWTYEDGKLTTTIGDTEVNYNVAGGEKTMQLSIVGQADKPPAKFNRVKAGTVAATTAPVKTIQGKWKANDGSVLEFTAENLIYGGNRIPYKAKAATLVINGTLEWQYQVDVDTLKLAMQGEMQTLTRVGEATAAEKNAAPKGMVRSSYLYGHHVILARPILV